MSKVLVPTLQVKSGTAIVKLRELPLPGEVLVHVGQCVSAADTVLRASMPGDLVIVRAAEKLGIEPAEVAKTLQVKAGQEVKQGDILCESRALFGLLKSRVLAPASGVLEYFSPETGHLGIRGASRAVALEAYVSGTVIEVEAGKAVKIECYGALVQGIIGVGGERRGALLPLTLDLDTHILPGHIPQDCRGKVLVGGICPSAEVLKLAASRGALGFVIGSIEDQALAGYLGFDLGIALTGDEDLSMTVIITEGFGVLPFSKRTFDLLKGLEGREASINGATQVRAGALRPEIIVALEQQRSKDQSSELKGLEVGSFVRIIRVPYFGEIAEIKELPIEPLVLETGAKARVLKAQLKDGSLVTVPRANVELLV